MPPWTTLIEGLAPEVKKAYEALSPIARGYLEKALPLAEERVVPVLNAMKKGGHVPASEWEAVETVAHPMAVRLRSQRLNVPVDRAGREITTQTMEDAYESSLPLREAAAAGQKGEPIQFPKPNLPATTEHIKTMADYNEAKLQYDKFKTLGDMKGLGDAAVNLKRLEPKMKDMTKVHNLPGYIAGGPWSPKTKSILAVGAEGDWTKDTAAAFTFMDNLTKNARTWWRSLTGKEGPGGGFRSLAKDKTFIKDMADDAVKNWPFYEQYYKFASVMRRVVDKFEYAQEKGNIADIEKYQKSINKVKPLLIKSLKTLNEKRYPTFSKYFDQPDVRIALYREPATRYLVKHLMQPGEIKVAEGHKWLMNSFRDLEEAAGIPVLEREKEYVTHLINSLPKFASRLDRNAMERMRRTIPAIIKFQRRNPGSLNMFPSITASTEAYIPMASRKIGLAAIKDKWKDIIDKDLAQVPATQRAAAKYMKQFFDPQLDEGAWDKILRGMTGWMYLTKVGLSIPTMFKHGLKFGANLAMHPLEIPRAIPGVVKGGLQLMFQKWGVKPGHEARLMRHFLASRSLYEDFSGLAGAPGLGNYLDKTTRLLSGMPVNWVEAFERGVGVMASINKANRKGMSYQKMLQGVYQTILENSFMGRADNFLWLNKPWQRFIGIFAYTPGQIIDRTFRWSLMGMKKEQYVKEMKAGVLQEGYRYAKDVYGTPYTRHLIAFLSTIGAAEMASRASGVTPWWVAQMMAAHIPGTRHTPLGTQLNVPIPYDVYQQAQKRGGELEDWTSVLYDTFTVFPALDRIKAQWRGELRKTAGGSELFHQLGIPSAEAEERMAAKIKKGGGRSYGWKSERKFADKMREKTTLGPLYNEYIKPWARK